MTITTPRIDKFANVRRQFDQAWCWSPGLADWLLVYDTKQAWQELNPLPAIGIRKPDPMPIVIERAPVPDGETQQHTYDHMYETNP